MHPQPLTERPNRTGLRLRDRVLLISGGDSGIGRAIVLAAAHEGASIASAYLNEHEDADETKRLVEEIGQPYFHMAGDVGDEAFCRSFVDAAMDRYGAVDVLVNNAGEQHPQEDIGEVTAEQIERTFRTNVFAQFFLVKAAVPHMKPGAAIVNVASVTAYQGNPELLDYSSTKGAVVSFTRALSNSIVGRGIRVNAIAPGPIWTPLIPATYGATDVKSFGSDTPMKRPGQPYEVADAAMFLASDDSSYISGQTLHVNGGQVVNS